MINCQLELQFPLPHATSASWCQANGFFDPRVFFNPNGDHIEDLLDDAGLPWMLVHTSEDAAIADTSGEGCWPAKAFQLPDGSLVVVDVPRRRWEIADPDGVGPSGRWVDAGWVWEE